ncbi:MAG: pantoate--beta-alanine ligase [Flavobacteriales bacterium]|nr:pantoate--beta-alanine ligase [Flavobacteriales bacterium]
MKVVHTISDLNNELINYKSKSIGFVPTMGSLHDGHISLVQNALLKAEAVIVSIFVNPTQFNNTKDFNNYPIDYDKDLEKLDKENVDVVFIPKSAAEIYNNEKPIKVDLNGIDEVMEGVHRKGHFDGVVRVLNLLFLLVKPHYAFFGEKDYQQLMVVKSMAKKHFKNIEIIGCPTKRDQNGLAMSSRNLLLKKEDHNRAIKLIKLLEESKLMFQTYDHKSIEDYCMSKLKKFSIPEYFEIREIDCLRKVGGKTTKQRAFVAAKIGDIRLIDNIEIN